MTTKEIYELSGEINDRLSDYRHDIASAIITCMNERGFKEIDLRKMREDCEKIGLNEVAERLENIAKTISWTSTTITAKHLNVILTV